jgi:hypothetical protein
MYLLWVITCLWQITRGLRLGTAWPFVWAGLAAGLGFLTRPEAAVAAAAGLGILWLARARGSFMASWSKTLACTVCLLGAMGMVAAPYWIAIGRVSNKPSVGEVTETASAPRPAPGLLIAARFMEGVNGEDWTDVSPWYALWEVLDESAKTLQYVFWVPALVALFWFRRRWLRPPGIGLVVIVGLGSIFMLWRLAARSHYVSERHTLLIGVCSLVLGLLMLFEWTERLAHWRTRLEAAGARSWLLRLPRPAILLCIALAGMTVWGTARSLRPLHENRRHEREAGRWFQQHAEPGDFLIDPYGFASFYAETVPELMDRSQPPAAPKRRFLLVAPEDRDKFRCGIIAAWSKHIGLGDVVQVWPSESEPKLIMYCARLVP